MKIRMVSIGMAILMLSACDKVVINYGEGSDVNEWQGEMSEEDGGTWVTCDIRTGGTEGTRSIVVDGASMTDLWAFDCGADECVVVAQQNSEDSEFGRVKFRLSKGTHTLAFVVSRGDDPEIDEGTGRIAWGKVKDTFWCSKVVEVSGTESIELDVTLQRVVGKMSVEFGDVVPDELKKVSTYVDKWLCGLDVRTGEGVGTLSSIEAEGTEMEVDVPAAYIGRTGLQISLWGFSRKAGFDANVDFVWRDAAGATIAEKRCEGVPIWANRVTKISGLILNSEAAVGVGVNGAWGEEYDYEM